MRSGVRLGLDLGAKRVGVARSDRDGVMAVPVTVFDATLDWHEALAALIEEQPILELVVGMPVSLRGTEEIAAQQMRSRLDALRLRFPAVDIRIVDERLSSSQANRTLRAAGHDTRSARMVVDAVAAAELLEFALEYERRTGAPAGELL